MQCIFINYSFKRQLPFKSVCVKQVPELKSREVPEDMFCDLTSSQSIQISIFRLFAIFSLLNTVPRIARYIKSLDEFMISFKTCLCFI